MTSLRYVVCDVFTDRPLEGNPLCVFTAAQGLSDTTMQALARETNLSETVFVSRAEGDAHAKIRIFTPVREVPFAGHPVLGTAFVVGGSIHYDAIRLATKKGVIVVHLTREASRPVFGWMEQPIPEPRPFAEREALLGALGSPRAESAIESYDNGILHTYVELGSGEAVAAVAPDFHRLAALPTLGTSTFAGQGRDWKTRMFAPAAGVNEDPATGSAAGPLALHLARLGKIAFGDEIRIEQGAEIGRPSVLYAKVAGTADRVERVEVGGSARIVARGQFQI